MAFLLAKQMGGILLRLLGREKCRIYLSVATDFGILLVNREIDSRMAF